MTEPPRLSSKSRQTLTKIQTPRTEDRTNGESHDDGRADHMPTTLATQEAFRLADLSNGSDPAGPLRPPGRRPARGLGFTW